MYIWRWGYWWIYGVWPCKAGAEVSLVARGPHKEAIQKNGLSLISDKGKEKFNLKVSDNTLELGEQDYVIIAVKAHAISPIVENLKPLLHSNTTVLSAVNGLPWWYFYKCGSQTILENSHMRLC